jgi:hypothetical protein
MNFAENELGMEEKRILPEAIDPKNAESAPENEKIPIYYFIYGIILKLSYKLII